MQGTLIDSEIKQKITELHQEWNKAEHVMKLAEDAFGEPIMPSVKELRYAGRRLVDALPSILAGEGTKRTVDSLVDAIFDCYRARHDAVDAATAFVVNDLATAVRRLGPDTVLKAFPKYGELHQLLDNLREKIAASRLQRENRDLIYESIITSDESLGRLFELYRVFKSSESMMVQLARRQRRGGAIAYAVGALGLIVGLAGLAIGLVGPAK